MATIKFQLRIEGAETPKQAVEIAQEIIAMLNCRLRGTPHTVEGRAQIPCPDCGKIMTLKDGWLTCQDCEARSEAEMQWEQFVKEATHPELRQHLGPMQPLEALLM